MKKFVCALTIMYLFTGLSAISQTYLILAQPEGSKTWWDISTPKANG